MIRIGLVGNCWACAAPATPATAKAIAARMRPGMNIVAPPLNLESLGSRASDRPTLYSRRQALPGLEPVLLVDHVLQRLAFGEPLAIIDQHFQPPLFVGRTEYRHVRRQ